MASSHKSNVMSLANDVKTGSLKDREKAVDELAHLLNPRNRSSALNDLSDKGYHEIFEAIFSFVLREKPSLYDKRKSQTTSNSAATRLSKCALAVRMAVGRGVSKLGRKTLLAVIDHITQVLPGPNNEFVAPLVRDYVKSLAELLSRQAHVEVLARKEGVIWDVCVDFLLDVVENILPEASISEEPLPRATPTPGTTSARQSGKSAASSQSQKRASYIEGGPLRDALEGLHHLIAAANAPVLRRSQDVAGVALRVLNHKQLSLGSVQTLCFSVVNTILSAAQADELSYSTALSKSLLPLMSFWWRADKVSQDELIRALRNEILRSIFLSSFHIEHLAVNMQDADTCTSLENLIEPLWLEYSRRSEAYRLQLGDLTFSPETVPDDYFKHPLFGLRPHNTQAESQWALVQTLSCLDAILVGSRQAGSRSVSTDTDQPRAKRKKTQSDSSLIKSLLMSSGVQTRQTALQIVPFTVKSGVLSGDELTELLEELVAFASDKNAALCSWALLACACCLLRLGKSGNHASILRQLWHIAAKLVSLPSTCRAACLLLHVILEVSGIQHHTITEDVNNIITTADVNGPAVLCDTSIALMLHLFHMRNTTLPSASLTTCSHVIRWAFIRWNPSDLAYAATQAIHVPLVEFANLLRVCCGGRVLPTSPPDTVCGGSLARTWKEQVAISKFMKYLLLLRGQDDSHVDAYPMCFTNTAAPLQASDTNSFFAPRKLTLELLFPKIEELEETRLSWTRKSSEGGTQVSVARFQSLLSACMAATMLLPQVNGLNTSQSSSIESAVMDLAEQSFAVALDSVEPGSFIDATLRLVRPCLPDLNRQSLDMTHGDTPELFHLLSNISVIVERFDSGLESSVNQDSMDIDDEFESQNSSAGSFAVSASIPRSKVELSMSPKSFYLVTRKLLVLIHIVNTDAGNIGLVPDAYILRLLEDSDEDLLFCQALVVQLATSDLVVSSEAALQLIERFGTIVSRPEYQCCEVALASCIGLIEHLSDLWTVDNGQLADNVGDLYNHFVKVCLPSNILSPTAQASMANLLFTLMKLDVNYASNLGLDSSRTSLLYILRNGTMGVKYQVSERIADIFELFILTTHDDIFVDVLDSLPVDPEHSAGIALRLYVLAKLACRWSTLLRRCTYHIFETPGKITQSTEHATRCLQSVSEQLKLDSPKELFHLFCRQLLFTWLESDPMEEIPFPIFGFASLADLLRSAQAEATALLVMRGQFETSSRLAGLLGVPESDLIRRNFTTVLAYSMIYGDAMGGDDQGRGETYMSKKMGSKIFTESLYFDFVDIAALFFDLIDQENLVEKTFAKHPDLKHASDVMAAIKAISHSQTRLPANQQPMFRAKYLAIELHRLSSKTEYDTQSLWTPVFVVSVARRILNTVHPALGSLHACSVLRKVRILVCLAGKAALEPYCCQMLLISIRAFIVDSECADDALGISQYLLQEGADNLQAVPSFMAGYALSTLASLRVFLESSQSSTTQRSQFKATMGKAQSFHGWFNKYLESYDSGMFASESQRQLFRSIVHSAAHIRSSGNAEKGTFESKLLLDILEDESHTNHLLDQTSRRLALELLCGDFTIPVHTLDDVIENDDDANRYAAAIWRSCETQRLSTNYLTWAGRVLGRSFSASGEVPENILRETRLSQYLKQAPETNTSETGLLVLLQELTSSPDSQTAYLGEAALRTTVSQSMLHDDQPLIEACQRTLTEALYLSSQWGSYRQPPSETEPVESPPLQTDIWEEDIALQDWLPRLSVHLAQSAPDAIILSALPRVLAKVPGFCEKAFPYIVHLALYFQMDREQVAKRKLSLALKIWLPSHSPSAIKNQQLLLNAILYLRTQVYPKETSIADRLHWLDVNYSLATSSASRCGMFKTALFFAELVNAENATRQSRRSSAAQETDIHDSLLTIFENIDDPDAYYGLPEDASLSKVLARVEYENEGTKSLAFRGAQYDSHIRLRDKTSQADAQALVQALSTLGLSGLSHSLLQTQQSAGDASSSLESTFRTARRLEIWNLPAPVDSSHHAVVVYKTYQSMHQATDSGVVRSALYDGFSRTMRTLAAGGHNATNLRLKLSALAALSELDNVLNVNDSTELDAVLGNFDSRTSWMRSGMYDDVSQILSCRMTMMSMLSQHVSLFSKAKVPAAAMKRSEVQSLITGSEIYRYHQATQESLNIVTALNHSILPCEELGMQVDAAIKIETANSLWDHGEMSTSIRMLQNIDQESALKKQSISVSRSDLLSQIAQKVSLARLEKPQDIQKKYLEPALKELKGSSKGKEAGQVFHQFAVFCDTQLQDPDGLEDLARLQSLRQGKSEEVAGLKSLISSTRDSQLKSKYSHVLNKEKQWLDLDEQELRRVVQTRSEFVRLSVENYLLSLAASDEHNNDALRFTALWLEHFAEDATNKAVMRHLQHVPTRKFATLMNQLTSRLQDQDTPFQKQLLDLVYNICVDHPYHGMYLIWSGTKARAQKTDEVATQRVKATEKVAQWLAGTKSVAVTWHSIDKASKYYHTLAMDRNPSKYKSGAKIPLKESQAAHNLVNCLARYRIPPPTMHIEVSASKDYSHVPMTAKLEPTMSIASGVSAPKIITVIASNGLKFKQLVKGGHDDLRQDAIMEQVFAAVSSLLKLHRATRQRNLGIRTYKVLPLTASSGLIEFVPNTIPLHEFLMPAHERYHPRDMKGSHCRKEIFNVQNRTVETRISTYRKVTEKFQPVLRYFFMENFVDPDEWFAKRLAYTRSTAAISMLGHVLGLGDRHGHNILLDTKNGEVVHIDLGVAFEAGRILPVPELVPFRLTRDIVDGMGITKTEGVFRRCCEFTLDALREEQYSIMTILDVLRYDPLYTWSISPLRLSKLQKARQNDGGSVDDANQSEAEAKKGKKSGTSHMNEPSEADRALEVVRKKLSKTLSPTATVNDLINQATDERNLAVLYSGWAAYA